MKRIFIPAKLKESLTNKRVSEISKKLPGKIAIVYSIQYQKQALSIKEQLSKEKEVLAFSQILGCSLIKFPKDIEAILVISSGEFHASSIANSTGKKVYVFDLHNLKEISKSDVEKVQKKKKASYLNFLHADNIGILVSTKPGQENLELTEKTKKKLENKFPEKQFFIFISNNINTGEFENFPDIKSWVNTACPRMDLEHRKIINISDLLSYIEEV